MPAKDRVHDIVVRALQKDGWRIVEEQYLLTIGKRRLLVDIHAEKRSETLAILVEVKSFENMGSAIEYLAKSIGKYVLYRTVLDFMQNPLPLFMAVPELAYNGILSEEIGKRTLQRVGARLIVFNGEREEIVRWI